MSKPTKNEYTYIDFLEEYPDDDACLEELFRRTYGQMECCPKCKSSLGYLRVKNRKAYQCRKCYFQVHPMRGTAFENTKLPLRMWFYAMFSFTVSKNGVSAHELSRAVGVSPKTALRMLRQIREFIINDESMMSGEVEIDETFVGGKNKNRHHDKKAEKSQGRAYVDKKPVLGLIESATGRAIAIVIDNVKKETLQPLIIEHVEFGSMLLSDEYNGYNGLEEYYDRGICNHSKKQYTSECGGTTNAVENFWSCLKRTLNGSYIKVSKKYLYLYVKEAVFRFNNRLSTNMFNDLLCCLA